MSRVKTAGVLLSSLALFSLIKPPPIMLLFSLHYLAFYDLCYMFTAKPDFVKRLFHLILAIYAIYSNLIIYSFYRQELFYHSLNIIGVISLSDALQYFFGKFYGKRYISPISPLKTLEGYIYGFLGTIAISLLVFQLQIVFVIKMILSGIVGDFFVSLIKRKLNVKDTSDLLGEHGGWIDRLDGIYMGFIVDFLF